jgi:hypothetical protein
MISETTALQNKIDAMLKRKKVKNNFGNMETIDTVQEKSETEGFTDLTEGFTDLTEGKGTLNTIGDDIKQSHRTRAQKWKDAFRFVTELKPKDMKIKFEGIKPKAEGWGKIFKVIFYIYPILVGLIVDDIVAAVPKTMEKNNISGESFRKQKAHDAALMKRTAYEFGNTIIAIYFSHMIFARLSDDEKYQLPNVQKFIEYFTFTGLDKYIIVQILCLYLTFLPTMVHFLLYFVLKNILSGFNALPTLKFIIIFIVCYGITHFFLDRLCKMFLQVFEFKASAFTYVMIVLAWFGHLLSMPYVAIEKEIEAAQSNTPTIPSEFDIMIKSRGLYIFVLLIHLAVSFLLAPLCQLVGVIYIAYAFFGKPFNVLDAIIRLFIKNDDVFKKTEDDCKKSNLNISKINEFWGGLDYYAYLFGYKYWFFFVMMIFFFFKTIQTAVEMKLFALRTAVTTINAYVTATMAVVYSAHLYFDKEVVIGTPVDAENDNDVPKNSLSDSASDIFTTKNPLVDPNAALAGLSTGGPTAALAGLSTGDPTAALAGLSTGGPTAAASSSAFGKGKYSKGEEEMFLSRPVSNVTRLG